MEFDAAMEERAQRFKVFYDRHIGNSMKLLGRLITGDLEVHGPGLDLVFHLIAGEKVQGDFLWASSVGSVADHMTQRLLNHLREANQVQENNGHGFEGIGEYQIFINNEPTETPDFQPRPGNPLSLIMANALPAFTERLNQFLGSKPGSPVFFHVFVFQLETDERPPVCEGIATNMDAATAAQLINICKGRELQG